MYDNNEQLIEALEEKVEATENTFSVFLYDLPKPEGFRRYFCQLAEFDY